MGKIKEIQIKRFDGGLAFDNRMAGTNQSGHSINFDVYKKQSTLTPVRNLTAETYYGGNSTALKTALINTLGPSFAGGQIFGIGKKIDGTGRKIYFRSGSSVNADWTDMTDSQVSAADAEAADGCPIPGSAWLEHLTDDGSLYWFVTGSHSTPSGSFRMLGLLDYTTAAAANFSVETLQFNPTFEPQIILGQDGNAYCSTRNEIKRLNTDGTVTDDAFVFGGAYSITSMCLYESYLAIAIKGLGRSKVVLWDYVDSQATETIEWGEGTLCVLENINGKLVGVSDKFINTNYNSAGSGQGVMQVKVWDGGDPVVVTEVKAAATLAGATNQLKYVKNNVLYWYAKIPTNAAATEFMEGIWSFGRSTDSHPWALTLYREVPSNIQTFAQIGDWFWTAHGTDGSISRLSATETYTLTSVYESPVFDGGDAADEKQFKGLTVSFEKLTSGQTVVAKYRKDGDTAWTTLTPAPAQATGDKRAVFPMQGNFFYTEIRLESTGGAKINGYKLRYEELTNALE